MRVFVCEFVTGGGLAGAALPASLVAEAALMRDAMRADLAAAPEVGAVLLAADARLPLPGARLIEAADDPWAVWADLARQADVVWPVAPETGGLLGRLVRQLRDAAEGVGARVVAATSQAIEITASKLETARCLSAAGLPHIPTFPLAAAPHWPGPRVTKPDDGAGCEDTRLWPAGVPLPAAQADGRLVAQPFVDGIPASLTVLTRAGRTRLLTINRQHIRVDEGRFALAGLTVGALQDTDGRLSRLAAAVAAAIDGLDGLFGIDILLTPDGPVVVEVNPRLTTAYAGLGRALGLNPARLALGLDETQPGPARPVEIALP